VLGGGFEVEKLMRLLPHLVLAGFAGVAIASPVMSQRADDQIQPKSVELQREAKALASAGKLEQAEDVLETSSRSIHATALPSSIWHALRKSSTFTARRSA